MNNEEHFENLPDTSVKRKNPGNKICDSLRIAGRDPLKIRGRLVVDQAHPYFFDHPLDHVPGTQLLEAMFQMAEVIAERHHEPAADKRLYPAEIRADFISFCGPDAAVRVDAEAADPGSLTYRCLVNDGVKDLCKCDIRFVETVVPVKNNAPADYDTKIKRLKPCRKDLVNRACEENVLISEPVGPGNDQGSRIRFSVLPLRNHSLFSDYIDNMVPALYLLNAFMQAHRFMGKTENLYQHDGLILQDILRSANICLKRPVTYHDIPDIEFKDTKVENMGKFLMRSCDAYVLVDGNEIGNCNIQTLMFNEDILHTLKKNNWRK